MPFYTPKPEQKNITLQDQIIVLVIVSISKTGYMRPLWFQIGDIKVKIDQIFWHKPNYRFGEIYSCGIVVNDLMQRIELTYHKDEKVWTIKEMK